MRALLLVAVVGCGTKKVEVEYHKVALPGFAVELPTHVKPDPSAAYIEGQVQSKFGYRVVLVSWQLGGIDDVEKFPRTVRSVVEQFATGKKLEFDPAVATQIGGQAATRVDGKFADVRFSFADVTCGARSVLLGVSGLRDFEQMRDRLFASFACAPIPAEEKELVALAKAAAGSVPIGIDDPALLAGWRRVDDDPVTLTITNGKTVAMFAAIPPEEAGEGKVVVPKLVAGGVFTMTGTVTKGTPSTMQEIERGTLVSAGETSLAAVTRWTCDDRVVVGVTMSAAAPDRDSSIEWLGKLRCSKLDDAPLPLGK